LKLLKSKKGGEFQAGIFLIFAVAYFFFFILVVNSSENVAGLGATNTSLVNIDLGTVEFDAIIGSSFCTNPRSGYDATTGESYLYSNAQSDRLFCEESIGIKGSSICSDIAGCSWQNVTSGWWFWTSTTSASCIGNINSSYYNIESTNPIIGRPRVKVHNNTGYWATYTPFNDPSACEHPNVLLNKTLCDMFSCSWEIATADTTFNSVGSIYSTIAEVFTFRYDFGFSNEAIAVLMNFIFIVLPLLVLIISLYFMIPLI